MNHCFDLFNGSVKPGDLITLKTDFSDRLKIVVDFEMALGVSETDATESVTQMVNQYSKDSFDLKDKVRKNIEAFNWKSYKDR